MNSGEHVRFGPALFASLLLLVGCRTIDVAHVAPTRPISYALHTATFPNGMRLVVYQDGSAREFTLDISHGSGARDDPPGKEGLAHLAQHLSFLGRQLGSDEPSLVARLRNNGLVSSALTTPDSSDFWDRGKPDRFAEAVVLEAQRMKNPLANLTEARFEAEREVVINELRQTSSPENTETEWLEQAAFASTPYARSFRGTEASLRKLTLDDVRAWYAVHDAAAGTIAVVTGPRDAREVDHLVRAAFGAEGGASGPVRPANREVPAIDFDAPPPPLVHRTLPVDAPRLWLAWTVPGAYSQQLPKATSAAVMLSALITYEFGDEHWVKAAGTSVIALDGAALVVAELQLRRASDAEPVRAKLDRNLDELQKMGFFSERGMQETLLLRHERSLQRIFAPYVAEHLRATGDPDYVGGEAKQITEQLTHFDDYARRYLTPARAVAMLVEPEEGAPVARPEQDPDHLGVERFDDQSAGPAAVASPELIRAVAGNPELAHAARHELSNGLQVVALRSGSLPLVSVRLVLPVDELRADEPAGIEVVSTQASWRAAIRDRDEHLIEASREVHATSSANEREIFAGSTVPTGSIDVVLRDLETWLSSPHPPIDRFQAERDNVVENLRLIEATQSMRANAALTAAAFPGHPYGRTRSAEALSELSRGQAEDWLDRQLDPRHARLIVVGDVEPGPALWSQLEARLGWWRGASGLARETVGAPELPPARQVVLFDQPGGLQAQLQLRVPGPEIAAEDLPALAAVAQHLTLACNGLLRERQAVSFGCRAGTDNLRHATSIEVATTVDRGAAVASLTAILQLLQALKERPLSEGDASSARWAEASGIALDFDTIDDVAYRLRSLAALRLPDDYWDTYGERLAALTPEKLQSVASRLAIGREAVVVVGDAQVLAPALKAAGYQVDVRLTPKPKWSPPQ